MAENIIEPIVNLVNGVPTTTSLNVAEKFEKKHQHVLEAIRKLIAKSPEEFGQSNFRQSSYFDEQGKEQRCYNLTRDGFSLLAMGFTGKAALAWKIRYIEAFNAMESELLKKSETRRNRKKAIYAPIDPCQAYLDEIENVRVKTAVELKRLLGMGLDLVDVYKFRTKTHPHFTAILIDWLAQTITSHSPLTAQAFSDCTPVHLIKELANMLPDIRK